MRRTLLIGIAILMVSCGKVDWRDATAPAAERAKALLKEMTLEEKVGQMCQYVTPPTRTSATRTWRTRSAEVRWDPSSIA